MNKAHTGVYLAGKLAKSLKDYGIEGKVSLLCATIFYHDEIMTDFV